MNLQNVIKILKRNKIQKRIKISKKSRKGSRTFGALNCQYFSIYQILGIIMKGIELKRKQNQIIIKTWNEIITHVEGKSRKRTHRPYLGEEWHNLIKTKVSSNGAYIQYESDGDTYFKALSLENCNKKIRKHKIDAIGKLKSTRP